MEVQFNDFVRGNWKADNLNDDARVYDLSAEVQITNERGVNAIVNGVAKKESVVIGSFSQQGGATIPSFNPQTADAMVAIEAYQAVITFASAIAAEATTNPPYNN